MEAGLKLGYEVAFDSMDKFKGNTRLMLFTDERPNVGKTDAASFIGMAKAASLRKVGLTTIGVGVQFGAELATRISSIRGGNLFFIQNENSVDTLFDKELDFMVSELAHDLTLTIKANPHYSIAGIYGVPGEMLGWQKDKSVSVVIPTVFLSSKGGAILISLAKNIEDAHLPATDLSIGDALADISLIYESALSGEKQSDSFAVKVNDLEPSEGMHFAYFLADEFTALHRATTEHYLDNDQERAYQIMNALNSRIAQAELKDIDDEKKLVAALFEKFAFLSGHGSESQSEANYVKLWDSWEIYRIRGDMDYKVKDIFVFTPDNKLVVIRKTGDAYDEVNDEEYKSSNKQIYLLDSEVTFNYSFSKNKLILKHPKSRMSIRLVRTNFNMNSMQ
jgi:Ca-activated chloride channel family protein